MGFRVMYGLMLSQKAPAGHAAHYGSKDDAA